MKYGLTSETMTVITDAISDISTIETVLLYGARAKGNYRNGSDIDITLLGQALTLDNSVYPLMDKLDDSYLPYTFDISIFEQIDNKDLIENIKRLGEIFYMKSKMPCDISEN